MPAKQIKSNTESKTESKVPKKKIVAKPEPESEEEPIVETDNDTSDSDDDKKVDIVLKKSNSDESEASDADDEDDPKYNAPKQEKKHKQTSAEIVAEKSAIFTKITVLSKSVDEKYIEIGKLLRERNAEQRKLERIQKTHDKSIGEDIDRARKEKPKRKGTGGFKKESVPLILRKYLNLPDDVILSRPDINSLLTTKFKSLNLKSGQITNLDETACKELGLSCSTKTILFKEFMSFIGSFYPPKVKS